MNYKNSTVRKVLLGATLFSILTTSLPNSVVAADTYATNNVESTSTIDKDENQWEADDFTYGKYEEPNSASENYVDYGVSVTGFSQKGLKKLEENKNLVIPEFSTDGDIVKGIGSYAFSKMNISSVSMPNSIEYISFNAFENSFDSSGIRNLNLSKNIRFIGSYAFYRNNIKNLDIPDTLEVIGHSAFESNKIESLFLPNSVNKIGDRAFLNNRIVDLSLPSDLQEIKERTFSGNRLVNINLPKNIVSIEKNAFSWNNIESVNLPNSLVNLNGFSNNKIKSLKIPETVKNIGENAFSRNMISKIDMPSTVEFIDKDSFSYNQISDLILHENLKSIGENAFINNKIKSVSIPKSVTFIGESAFNNNEIESFKNFPSHLISSDNGKITYTTGYLGQRIKVHARNGIFKLNLEDSNNIRNVENQFILKKPYGFYYLKKIPQYNYRDFRFNIEPYWEVSVENSINFKVDYDANGGFGQMESEEVSLDNFNKFKLPDNKFTPPAGKRFIGWTYSINFADDYKPKDFELRKDHRLFRPGHDNLTLLLGNLQYAKTLKFIAQREDINKDTNPPRRPDNNRPNIQDVNLNNTKDYIKRLLRNEGILTPFKSNQIDKAQTVDELIYLNNLYLKDKFNNNKSTHTIVEKHYIEKPVYIYNETRYTDRNVNSHIASYVPKYVSNDFKKSDEKQINAKGSNVQKNNNKYFKFLIGMNLYYKNIDGRDELFEMDVAPFIENDRTMMPLRYVAEALSCDVKWDNKTRTASFTKDGVTASIQIDGNEIVLSNGERVKMDSKPIIKNDRLCVSLTNVAKVFNLTNGNTKDKIDQDIEWDQESKTVTISFD